MALSKRKPSSLTLTSVEDMNAMFIRRSRHKPEVGDVLVLNMLAKRWIAGRVVRTDVKMLGGDNLLLYFYRMDVPGPDEIKTPMKPELLIPPILTTDLAWRRGFYAHVRNAPLASEEVLPRHVFDDRKIRGGYLDEYWRPVPAPEPGTPCAAFGLANYQMIDYLLSKALDIPPKVGDATRSSLGSATAGTGGGLNSVEAGDSWVTLRIPASDIPVGEMELSDLEDGLIHAVSTAKAGKWEGHGTNLRTGVFDMRFYGPDAERIIHAMRPVLRRAAKNLPAGWYLTKCGEDGDREERVDLS